VYKEKAVTVVQDLIPPRSIIYIHMCALYTYTIMCMPRFSPSGFFGPSRCLVPTPGLTPSTPSVQCVCVCAYTHTYTHIHSYQRYKQRRHRQHPYLSFCQKQPPTPSNKCLYRLVKPAHPRSPMLNETNCTYMRTYAHPAASVKQMCTLMFTICLTYTPVHAWCSKIPVNAFALTAKNAYALVHARLCNGAEASLP
jgi:hypothetical protein